MSQGVRRETPYHKASPGGGYYYSRGVPVSFPSPSSAMARNGHDSATLGSARRGLDESTPSYFVEHLATFAVGRQYGLTFPSDGVRKLKQMEKSSAIWAQPMILRLRPAVVSVEDENGFPIELVEQPTAHISNDPRDAYNNILLFIVREDRSRRGGTNPTEMHIFQCNGVPASEVAEDLRYYVQGQFKRVRNGRRRSTSTPQQPQYYAQGDRAFRDETFADPRRGPPTGGGGGGGGVNVPDDASISSDGSELFERDVNTLNRCFDDIERFVARIQSAALAQRELEAQRSKRSASVPPPDPQGILHMRAQLPLENEFVDIFRKFKLSFNLLAKLKNHIHEPNAPELLHFLFTPLTVILEACQWGLGRSVAPQITSPLLSLEARELMQNCLTSKESDVWMALGDAWRIPPEDWPHPLPPPYRPVFLDGFAPYGAPFDTLRPSQPQPQPQPLHRGVSAPPPQSHYPAPPVRDRSVDNDLDRLSLERERLEFERQKILERERRLLDGEKHVRAEHHRLEAERRLLQEEAERRSLSSTYRDNSVQPSPLPGRNQLGNGVLSGSALELGTEQSPRQRAFVQDLINRKCKLVQATYDRVAQNPKELTVSRGEYLEVLNDAKNWWECRNVHSRVGYVPHTILSVVPVDSDSPQPQGGPRTLPGRERASERTTPQERPSPRPGTGGVGDDLPSYIKQRQGKRGEFRYF